MVNQAGDGAIKEQHQPKPGTSDSLHHEIHSTPHSKLLQHATSSKASHSDHLPPVCIVDNHKKPSVVADEDQNQDKLVSRMAIKCPVNPEQPNKNALDSSHDAHPTYPVPKKDTHGDQPAKKSSLVADEDQNQDKLISRMALQHAERK